MCLQRQAERSALNFLNEEGGSHGLWTYASLPGTDWRAYPVPPVQNLTCIVNSSIVSEEQNYLSQSALAQQQQLICERMDNEIMNYPSDFFSGPSTLCILLKNVINYPLPPPPHSCYFTYSNTSFDSFFLISLSLIKITFSISLSWQTSRRNMEGKVVLMLLKVYVSYREHIVLSKKPVLSSK